MSTMLLALLLCALASASFGGRESDNAADQQNNQGTTYGVDVSIPIHHHRFRDDDPSLSNGGSMAHRRRFYRDFMNRWKQNLIKEGQDPSEADEAEEDRIQGNLEQPAMVVNYTSTGYLKVTAPKEVSDMLSQFWENNKHLEEEEGQTGIINQLDIPTAMVSLDDDSLRGSGERIKQAIWDATRPVVSEWTGQQLVGSSIYGIRVYKEGSVLLPHVDRLPLVCSAIINVAQSVEEPWPLEVYDRQGKAVNITLSPGEMVLYESHSLIHGRPFPLKGEYYSNVFVHFEPISEGIFPPPYIVPGTDPDLIDLYYTQELQGNEVAREDYDSEDGDNEDNEELDDWSDNEEDWEPAHYAAYKGNVEALRIHLDGQQVKVNDRDGDGWTLLAYAAHSGHIQAVRFLVESGANVAIIVEEDGGGEEITAHEIARRNWGGDSDVVKYLNSAMESCGALNDER